METVSSNSSVADNERFSFGANWLSFVDCLDDARIAEAEKSLQWLCGANRLDGRRFIDIGSGSGLFSLIARRLGASVFSFDYDANSVESTRKLRDRFFPNDPNWIVERGSVLDVSYLAELGEFDIVYSWGVLHHTGLMYDAIKNAAARIAPGGLLIIALYRKTTFCRLWAMEKRWYASARPEMQNFARKIYIGLLRIAFWLRGRNFGVHLENYHSKRGMSFLHDVHDWMGGYPYESISPDEFADMMRNLGLVRLRDIIACRSIGLFGSGCDEYVYQRVK